MHYKEEQKELFFSEYNYKKGGVQYDDFNERPICASSVSGYCGT